MSHKDTLILKNNKLKKSYVFVFFYKMVEIILMRMNRPKWRIRRYDNYQVLC
jgi:hypothetical protein